MSSTGGWVPPESIEPVRPRPSTPAAETPVGPQLNPVSAQSSPARALAHPPANGQPWSRSRKWTLGVGITAAVLGVFAAVGAAGAGLYTAIIAPLTSYVEPLPLLEGEPGDPRPLEATECDDPCYGEDHQWEAKLDAAAFERLGTPVVRDPSGTYLDSTPREQYDQTLDYWRLNGYAPDTCAFTGTESPVATVIGSPPSSEDPIYWLTSFESEDGISIATRAMRLFPTAAAAQEHLAQQHRLVSMCDGYGYSEDERGWGSIVTPMPALEIPPVVAAVGWTESLDGFGRYYVVDVMRSNAVVRLLVWTNNSITEESFRALATTMAVDMSEWPEVPGGLTFLDGPGQPETGFQPESSRDLEPRLACAGECFTAAQALSLAPTPDDLAALGLTAAGSAAPVAAEAGPALDARQLIETSNAQCRFALGVEPVVRGNPRVDSGSRTDELVDLGRFERSGTSIRIVARVFENAGRAEAYAAATEYALSLCSRQLIVTPQGDVEVTMLPAQITGYDSIDDPIVPNRPTTHYGWQHDGGRSDRGHELQHGNLVVRVVIESSGSNTLDEQEIAGVLLPMIERLEGLEP